MFSEWPEYRPRANSVPATSCRESRGREILGNISPTSFAIVVTDVWGVAAPAAIHQYTGRPERTCRAWASDHNEAGASELIAILRGKEGYVILKRIMRDEPPDWWRNHLYLLKVAAIAEDCFAKMAEARR